MSLPSFAKPFGASRLIPLLALLPWMPGCQSSPAGDRGTSAEKPAASAPATPAVGTAVTAAATETTGGRARWHYEVRPSAALDRIEVQACFAGRVPERLVPQVDVSRNALRKARGPAGRELALKDQGLELAGISPGECATLVFDVPALVKEAQGHRNLRQIGRDLFISPDYWLWKPSGGLADADLTVSFALPANIAAAVPWPRLGENLYAVPETSFAWGIHGAIGHFTPVTLEVAGARLHVIRLGDSWEVDAQVLHNWIRDAARAVALLYGEFPVAEAQIILTPVPGAKPVFGLATQGGGPGLLIMTGVRATPETLRDDWVAVHEMLHFGTPMVTDEGNWLTEGLATYYEPLLRARAGLISATEAWEILHEGFGRGRRSKSGRTLREESQSMHTTREYWRVYWAGAAIALIADVALRQKGRSLDEEMRRMRACCLQSTRTMTPKALMQAAASPDGGLSLSRIAAGYVDLAGFPDVTGSYTALGLSFDEKQRAVLSDQPAARALRAAMTGP